MSKTIVTKAFPRIVGADAIGKAIASIALRGANLDRDIHIAGVSALAHAASRANEGHGDPSLLDKLVNAMPKGSRRLALVEWILAYGQVRKLVPSDKADNEAIKGGRIFAFDKERKLDLASAEATPWHEFRREPSIQTAFDAQAAVKSIIQRVNAAAQKGMTIEGREQALADAKALVRLLSQDIEHHPDGTHHAGDTPSTSTAVVEPEVKAARVRRAKEIVGDATM